MGRNSLNWTQEMLDVVGTDTDKAVAQKLGISLSAVRFKRLELLRPPIRTVGSKKYEWTPEVIALLGTDIDRNIAEKTGIPFQMINMKRRMFGIPANGGKRSSIDWSNEMIAELPTMTASDFARKYGINMRTVIYKCREFGLGNFMRATRHTNEKVPDWIYPLLGKWNDAHLAEVAGVSRERIRQIRAERGIPKPSCMDIAQRELLAYLQREGILS